MVYNVGVWIKDGKLISQEIRCDKPVFSTEYSGKFFSLVFDSYDEALDWVNDFINCIYIWKAQASMGAAQCLFEFHQLINDMNLKQAERLAILRSEKDGYKPGIRREDVVNAIKIYSDVEVE